MGTLPRVLFVTTGLGLGGAERFLLALLGRLHRSAIEAGVVSLASSAELASGFQALGIPVWSLGLPTPVGLLRAVPAIVAVSRRFQPDIVHGWMYHGNIVATLLSMYPLRGARLLWSVRQSLPDIAREKLGTRCVIRLGARWSARAGRVIFNSVTARVQHLDVGYCAGNVSVIDNGVDVDAFVPNPGARDSVRAELGWPGDAPLLGLVGRFHPVKGHEVFLGAARRLADAYPDLRFLLAGTGVVPENPVLRPWLEFPELKDRVALLGARADVPRLVAALDISCLASHAEAFPNILIEAMSCAVPVVATDVGDVRRIVGEHGSVVPPADTGALAAACAELLDRGGGGRQELGLRLRERVVECFSLDVAAGRYAELYAG